MNKADTLLISKILLHSFETDGGRSGLGLKKILIDLSIEKNHTELTDIYSLLKTTELIDDKSCQSSELLNGIPTNTPSFSLNPKGVLVHKNYGNYKDYIETVKRKSLISTANLNLFLTFITLILALLTYLNLTENIQLKEEIKGRESETSKLKEKTLMQNQIIDSLRNVINEKKATQQKIKNTDVIKKNNPL